MSDILNEILQETQLSESQRERLANLEEQYGELINQVSQLKNKVLEQQQKIHELEGQLPSESSDALSQDDRRMLVRLFNAQPIQDGRPFEPPVAENDLGALANALGMDRGMAK